MILEGYELTKESRKFSSEVQKVLNINSEAQRAWQFHEKDRLRNITNWEAYFALDGSQWPKNSRERLNSINKQAAQYNIIAPKIDVLVGSLMTDEYDLDWKPIEGIRNSLTEAIKSCYYVDNEIGNFSKEIEAVVRDGLIMEGYLKMHMSDRYNPLKNIAFSRVEPGYVIMDPYHISDRDWECKKAWEFFFLSAQDIMEKYNIDHPYLGNQAKLDKLNGGIYEPLKHNPNQLFDAHTRGHLWKVVEHHYIQEVKTTRIIGQKLDSDIWMPFPLTNDKAILEKFMIANFIDPTTMMDTPYNDRVHKVCTIAPEVVQDKILEHGASTIQCKRLPYFLFTASRAFGRNKGIVDDLYDLQQTINKRESKMTDLIATAQGGGKLVNKNLFSNVTDKKEFQDRANDPSYIGFVDGDEMTKERAITYINSAQFPSTLVNQIERTYGLVDRVSKVPAAMEAISENAAESGTLFEKKLAVGKLNTLTLGNRIKDFRREIASAYYEQWSLSYNGPQRAMSTSDGKHNVVLNERIYKNGKVYIRNRPAVAPRCLVVCTESKTSPNKQMRDRAVFSEIYNLAVQSGRTDYADIVFKHLMETVDLSEESKMEIRVLEMQKKAKSEQMFKTEMLTLEAQGNQSAVAALQAQMQIQQMMQPQQAPPQPVDTPEEEVPQEMGDEMDAEDLPSPEEETVEPMASDEA